MILREEGDGGRVMVMSDDERVRPGERTEIRLWSHVNKNIIHSFICRLSGGESLICERENLIFDTFIDF